MSKAKQNDRFAVVLKITEAKPEYGHIMVSDYLPAGLEIDNPHLVSSGDTGTLDWIEDGEEPENTEFRDDRFTAAIDRASDDNSVFTVAYVVRAVSPGKYVLPQAYVEDMYNPSRYGRTGTGSVEVRSGEMSAPSNRLRRHGVRQSRAAGRRGIDGGGKLDTHRPGGLDVHHAFWRLHSSWLLSLGGLARPVAAGAGAAKSPPRSSTATASCCAPMRWPTAAGGCRSTPRPASIPAYLKLLLAYEDRRFRIHAGVDPLALGRAAFQLLTRGHIVSGGSTITMQLARLMEPRRERSVYAKLRQMVRALEIERQMSKDQILDLYLAMAPFGGNLEGIRAASIAYFGKEPKRLSLAESALLVALPQSPETRRLDRYPDAARAARDRVLDRMVEDGIESPQEDAAGAKAVPVPRLRKPMPILAPHSADQAMASVKDTPVIALTLDAGLQKVLEALARDRAVALGPNISVAIIAVDNASGDVLARVGSPDYFDDRRAGQVDMTRAVRSPGSTLKPFIYGLAFEDGFVHPESLIDDRPIRFGSYAPENFDMTFQGTVPVRKALQMSLNVPAVALLDRVGASRLSARLKQAGANLVLPKDEAPGLAMGLGGVGITLQDLVQLYCGLARLGNTRPLREIMTVRDDGRESPAAAGPGRGVAGRQRADGHAAAGEWRA